MNGWLDANLAGGIYIFRWNPQQLSNGRTKVYMTVILIGVVSVFGARLKKNVNLWPSSAR